MKRSFIVILILACALRFLTLGLPDLTDPSESRFANAARHMVETGDWLTPRIIELHNGWEPYLAKPPLHIWTIALSFKAFGASAWSARLVPFLAVCLTFFWLSLFARRFLPELKSDAQLLFATLPGVFFLCCSATTDPLLMMWITGSVVTAALAQQNGDRRWWYLHCLLLGFGFLTKGPVAVVLVWVPLVVWGVLEKRWDAARSFPWIVGPLLFLLVASPWYILSEMKNPGFIYYFFIQENIGRYLYKDFGIKFGSTHQKPYGTSIAYFVAVLLPWSLTLLAIATAKGRAVCAALWKGNATFRLLVLWALFPPLFFIFARQILPTYLYPSIVPGLMASLLILNRLDKTEWIKRGAPILLSLSALVLCFSKTISKQISFRDLGDKITQVQNDPASRCEKFLFAGKLPQSLYFYHRELLGDFDVADEESLGSITPQTCVVLPKKMIEKDLRMPVTEVANSNRWAVVKTK